MFPESKREVAIVNASLMMKLMKLAVKFVTVYIRFAQLEQVASPPKE